MNCPQHIPQKFDAADVAKAIEESQTRITALESENAALRRALAQARVGVPAGDR